MLSFENEFLYIFENEVVSTIEAFSGVETKIKHKNTKKISFLSSLIPESVLVKLKLNFPKYGSILLAFPVSFVINLNNKVLKNKGNNRKKINDDDLDMLKEVVENIFGAISNTIDYKGGNFQINVESVFLLNDNTYILEEFCNLFEYSLSFNKREYSFLFIVDKVINEINSIENSKKSQEKDNINLLMDNFLEVKVRIGGKYITMSMLEDIKNGKVFNIDTNLGFSVDIIIQEQIIAYAEVLIIDGNFGFQIIELLDKPKKYNLRPYVATKSKLDPLILLDVVLGTKNLKIEEINSFNDGYIVDLDISFSEFFKMYVDDVFISYVDLKVYDNNTEVRVINFPEENIKLPLLLEEDKENFSKKEYDFSSYKNKFSILSSYSDATLCPVLMGEHPQIITVVLLNIDDTILVQNILSGFDKDLLKEVIIRMAKTKKVSRNILFLILSTLLENIKYSNESDEVDGFNKVTSLLTSFKDKNKVLKLISEIDSGLSKTISREINKKSKSSG